MTRRRAWRLAALGALVLSSCGEARVEHEAHLRLSDPGGRLGAAPWKVAMMETTSVYDRNAESALALAGGEAGPGHACVGRFHTSETAWVGSKPRPRVLPVGLVLPALTREGWWSARIVILDDGAARGYARFCPWGSLNAEGSAEILMMKGRAHRRSEGWQLDLTLEIPPARPGPREPARPSSIPPAP